MIGLAAFGRPCPCEDCGADRWRQATEAEADDLEREIGLPDAAGPRIAAFYWTCCGCGNGSVVIVGGFEAVGF